jgi:hypothetical protein
MPETTLDTLGRLDRYFDAVPRSSAVVEEVGPFTLFVGAPGSTYYARPRLGLTDPITPDDVEAVALRCRQLGLKTSIEWVAELTPSLEEPRRSQRANRQAAARPRQQHLRKEPSPRR